jgi:hemoglobin-like flavoprotein
MADQKFKRDQSNKKSRKKGWDEKTEEVTNSYLRASVNPSFYDKFYENLFFLNPKVEKYFINTKWDQQKILIKKGVEHLLGFLGEDPDSLHHQNIIRLSESHSKSNLNIHPHHYYYWIDAMILTLKDCDPKWYDALEFYTRECLFLPVSFMISFYHK